MASSDVKPEVQAKTTGPADAGEAAKAREKLLHDSQAAKQPTPKELTAVHDTEQLVIGFKQAFADHKVTPEVTNKQFAKFASATTDAERNKVFTDAGVAIPDVVKQYESKYGASTRDAIYSSVALAKRMDQQPAPQTAPVAAGGDRVTTLNNAASSIDKARAALQTVQPDGKPIPDSTKQVFQSAIDAASLVTPAMITAQRDGLLSSIPGWTPAKENQYQAVNQNFTDARQNLSPAIQAQLDKMPAGTTASAKTAAAEAITNDPTAIKLKQADAAATAFYNANPAAANRDQIIPQLKLLVNLSHGKAFASALYADALGTSGNAADFPQAKALMADAAKDKNLTEVLPGIQKLYDGVMALDAPAAPATAPGADPLDAKIPGWTQTKAAVQAMEDQSLSPEQRMTKAAPLFETALQAANSISPADVDKAKLDINAAVTKLTDGQVKSMDELLKPENQEVVQALLADPAKKDKAIELNDQNNVLNQTRMQNLVVSEAYAQALTKTASELQAQANGDPTKAAQFNREANAMSDKAASVLKDLGQRDPNFGVPVDSANNKDDATHQVALNRGRITEEIAQASRGEVIDPSKAVGMTGAKSAVDAINESIMGHTYNIDTELFGTKINGSLDLLKAVRPLEVGVNVTVAGLEFAGDHTPIVGGVFNFGAGILKGQLPSPENAMGRAVEDTANAKLANPEAAKAEIDAKKHEILGNAVGTGADVFSGQIGLQAERFGLRGLAKAAPLIAKALPGVEETAVKAALEGGNWKVRLGAAVVLGGAAAFGSRVAADELSHEFLGTKKMSAGELASHSAMSLASAYTARALSERLPGTTGSQWKKFGQTALTSGLTSATFGVGEVNPFLTNKATGQHFTVGETVANAGENLAFGATAGMAGRALTPFVNWSTVGMAKGVGHVVGGTAKFVFNSQAGKEAVADTAAAAGTIVPKEAAPLWQNTSGFMGTSLGSAALRGGVGTGIGAVGSFVAVNPWEKNDATGKNYTVGETATSAVEWGLGTGAALAASRYPFAAVGTGYRAATNALPGEGSTFAKFMGTNAIAATERFGVGGTVGFAGNLTFGDKTDANGKDYTTAQILGSALTSGLEYGSVFAAAPYAKNLINPAENSAESRFMATNFGGFATRFAAGSIGGFGTNLALGDRTSADGKELTIGERLTTATERGLGIGSVLAVSPYAISAAKFVNPTDAINASRRFLGTAAEKTGTVISNGVGSIAGDGTTIGNKVIAPVTQVVGNVSKVATDAAKQHGPGFKQNALSFSLPLSTSASELYEHHELKKLDELSDQRAKDLKDADK